MTTAAAGPLGFRVANADVALVHAAQRSDDGVGRNVADNRHSWEGGIPMTKVNLAEKLAQFTDHWSPRIVGELNGQHVKLVKLEGEFVWHHHKDEDEMFFVLRGHLDLQLRDAVVALDPGEFFIVPRGVEHRPVAASGEVHLLLFEPASTLNTGNVRDGFTIDSPARL
jgi:mannose-6-phosphate isomerase-like protein (cupin superfamily)